MSARRLVRVFAGLWIGETAFDVAAALMGFALGVWVYQRTGSAEQFSFTVLAAALPALFATPLAGFLADRYDRARVIVVCDGIHLVMLGALAYALWRDGLVLAHLLAFNAAMAVVKAVRAPSYQAAIGTLVPAKRLAQANGLLVFTRCAVQVVAPMAAGELMAGAGLRGVMVVELLTVAAGALAVCSALIGARRLLMPARTAQRRNGLVAGYRAAAAWLSQHRPMAFLLAYAVLQEGLLALVSTMITPLVLATHTAHVLGLALACGAAGGLAGSLMTMVVRPHRRLMTWVLVADAVLSGFVLLAGLADAPVRWCVAAFGALLAASASMACSGALWMRKTPKAMQGSVFSLLVALGLVATCVTTTLGASIGERLFEPAMTAGGAWAATFGPIVGIGKGRGIGLLFVLCGALGVLLSLAALALPGVRRLDALVGDAPLPSPSEPRRHAAAAT